MTYKLPKSAGGWGAIRYSLKMARRAGGMWPMMKALFSRNSCKSCALGMGGQKGGLRDEKGYFPSVCNKSFLAQASDMQGVIPQDFFNRHDIQSLSNWTPQQLELSGRLTEPLLCEQGDTHYRIITWEKATQLLAEQMSKTDPSR
ncbi:MAG: histidine kinase, partial [Nitrospinales bacterium]